MPSNPDSGFHFRDVELASFYDQNYPRSRRSIAAKQDLERYQNLLQEERKRVIFTEEEAVAVWDTLNGCNTSHVEELGILRNAVISEIADMAVDNPGLRQLKGILLAMSPGQWMAVVDACDRAGAGNYHIENLSDELKRVGLLQ